MKFELLLTLAALKKEQEFLEIKKEFESNSIQNFILSTIYARFFYNQNSKRYIQKNMIIIFLPLVMVKIINS